MRRIENDEAAFTAHKTGNLVDNFRRSRASGYQPNSVLPKISRGIAQRDVDANDHPFRFRSHHVGQLSEVKNRAARGHTCLEEQRGGRRAKDRLSAATNTPGQP